MTMYTLKPIISLAETLYHRKPMYEMRNIHEERSTDNHTETENKIVPDITEQVINFLKIPLPEYNALEARQEMILVQLAELKQQVSVLSSFLKQTNHIAKTDNSPKSQELITVHLIVNVNPTKPPYFISALQRIWEDIDIIVQSYVHSNVSKEGLKSYHSTTTSSVKNIINLTLIWKDVQDLELVSGLERYHITGETNLLRYLSRLFDSHSYEKSACKEDINRINLILDLCHSIHFEKSSKKQQEVLLLIADNIGTNWSDKKTPDIADIAAWSTIKQVSPKKYPSKLNRWFDTCEKLFV